MRRNFFKYCSRSDLGPGRGGVRTHAAARRPKGPGAAGGKCAFRPEAGKMHEISNLFLQPYAPDDPQSRPRPETDGGGRQATAGCGEIFSNIVLAPISARAVVVSALMPRRGGPKARARPGENARSAPRQEKCTKYRISFCSLTRLMTRSQGRGLRLMEVDGKRRPDAAKFFQILFSL